MARLTVIGLSLLLSFTVFGCADDDGDGPLRIVRALGALPDGRGVIVAGSVDGYGYEAYIPVNYDETVAAPILIGMHGTGGSAGGMLSMWASLADTNSFIVLAPSYNDNSTYFTSAGEAAIFDMLDELSDFYAIDHRRRYANGVSTGGSWSFVFAIENSLSIAAASVFAGGYTADNTLFVSIAARKIPFHLSHGSADGVLSVSVARDARDALVDFGHDVEYAEHSGGHFVPAGAPGDAWSFMEDTELAFDPLR